MIRSKSAGLAICFLFSACCCFGGGSAAPFDEESRVNLVNTDSAEPSENNPPNPDFTSDREASATQIVDGLSGFLDKVRKIKDPRKRDEALLTYLPHLTSNPKDFRDLVEEASSEPTAEKICAEYSKYDEDYAQNVLRMIIMRIQTPEPDFPGVPRSR